MPDIGAIQRRLNETVGLRPSAEWVRACVQHLQGGDNGNGNGNDISGEASVDRVLYQVLHSDLREVVRSESGAPDHHSMIDNDESSSSTSASSSQLLQALQLSTHSDSCHQQLPSDFSLLCQIEEVVDMALNAEKRMAQGSGGGGNVQHQNPQRCLKLLLTDGRLLEDGMTATAPIVAMEVTPIPQLSVQTLAGTKVLLQGPALTVRWGLLQLHGGNTTILGGSVAELVDHQRKALVQAQAKAGVGVDATILALIGTDGAATDALEDPTDEGEGESGDVVATAVAPLAPPAPVPVAAATTMMGRNDRVLPSRQHPTSLVGTTASATISHTPPRRQPLAEGQMTRTNSTSTATSTQIRNHNPYNRGSGTTTAISTVAPLPSNPSSPFTTTASVMASPPQPTSSRPNAYTSPPPVPFSASMAPSARQAPVSGVSSNPYARKSLPASTVAPSTTTTSRATTGPEPFSLMASNNPYSNNNNNNNNNNSMSQPTSRTTSSMMTANPYQRSSMASISTTTTTTTTSHITPVASLAVTTPMTTSMVSALGSKSVTPLSSTTNTARQAHSAGPPSIIPTSASRQGPNTASSIIAVNYQKITYPNLRKLLKLLVTNRTMYEQYQTSNMTFEVTLLQRGDYRGDALSQVQFNIEKKKERKKKVYAFWISATFGEEEEESHQQQQQHPTVVSCKLSSSLIESYFAKPAAELRALSRENKSLAEQFVTEGGENIKQAFFGRRTWKATLFPTADQVFDHDSSSSLYPLDDVSKPLLLLEPLEGRQ